MSQKLVRQFSISTLILIILLGTSQSNIVASAEPRTTQERWAIIEDINKDRLKMETTNEKVWAELVQLYQNGSERWIGGIVEIYINEWGFRFNPDTILVAEITIEAWQTTIRDISQRLDYWLGNMAVVAARITEIHELQPVGGVVIPVDKSALIAPYIGLTCIILAILVAAISYAKHKKAKNPERLH